MPPDSPDDDSKYLFDVPPPKPVRPYQTPDDYRALYQTVGDKYSIDPDLLYRQAKQESINFNPRFVYGPGKSPKGAAGLAQFMPSTARTYGLQMGGGTDDRFDPTKAADAHGQLMRDLLDRHGGDERLALAAYNSGTNKSSNQARRAMQRIPETRDYVAKIMAGRTPAPQTAAVPQTDDSKYLFDVPAPSDAGDDSKYLFDVAPAPRQQDIGLAANVRPPSPTGVLGPVAAGVSATGPAVDEPVASQRADQLANDISWHFGPATLNAYHLLDAVHQQQIAKRATQLRIADEAKKRRGESMLNEFGQDAPSPAWQLQNRQKLGLDKAGPVRDELISQMTRAGLIDQQSPDAQAAQALAQAEAMPIKPSLRLGSAPDIANLDRDEAIAQAKQALQDRADYKRRLTANADTVAQAKAETQKLIQDQGGWTPGVDKWITESLMQSGAHVGGLLAGAAKVIGTGSEGRIFNYMWGRTEGIRQAVEEESQGRSALSKIGQSTLSGLISPEIAATALGVPAAAAFGVGGGLESLGRGEPLLKAGRTAFTQGAIGKLYDIPVAGSPARQALSKAGIVGAGTYAATGDPSSALANALFAASGPLLHGEQDRLGAALERRGVGPEAIPPPDITREQFRPRFTVMNEKGAGQMADARDALNLNPTDVVIRRAATPRLGQSSDIITQTGAQDVAVDAPSDWNTGLGGQYVTDEMLQRKADAVTKTPDQPIVPGADSFNTFDQQQRGFWAKVQDVAAANPGARVVVPSHYNEIKWLEAGGLKGDINTTKFLRSDGDPGDIYRLTGDTAVPHKGEADPGIYVVRHGETDYNRADQPAIKEGQPAATKASAVEQPRPFSGISPEVAKADLEAAQKRAAEQRPAVPQERSTAPGTLQLGQVSPEVRAQHAAEAQAAIDVQRPPALATASQGAATPASEVAATSKVWEEPVGWEEEQRHEGGPPLSAAEEAADIEAAKRYLTARAASQPPVSQVREPRGQRSLAEGAAPEQLAAAEVSAPAKAPPPVETATEAQAAIGARLKPIKAGTIVELEGKKYFLGRSGDWYFKSSRGNFNVENPATIAKLNEAAKTPLGLRPERAGEGGFIGEKKPPTPEAVEEPEAPHPSATQRRAPTGEFAEGGRDYAALNTELMANYARYKTDYDAIANHRAQTEGLANSSAAVIRDYFTKLRNFVAVHNPDKMDLLDQAVERERAGDNIQATILAQRALSGTHDYTNRVNNASVALAVAAEGHIPASIDNALRTVVEARDRVAQSDRLKWRGQEGFIGERREEPIATYGRSGAVSDIPSATETDTKYDLRAKPKSGVADIAEVSKVAQPIYAALKFDAARLIDEKKLDPAKFTDYIRRQMNARVGTEGWHKVNERAAYKLVTDLAKRESYDPASRSFRTTLPTTSKFVDDTPLNFQIEGTDRTTARDLRREYSGAKNAQVVIGNNIAKQLKSEVKDKVGREGIYFNVALGGDKAALQSYLDNPSELLDPYRPALQRALDLKPWEQKWAKTLRQGYDELGDYSRALGTINNVKENYHNRIYVQEKAGKDFVQSEAFRQGLGQYTGHAKPQVYANVLDAVLGRLPDGNQGTPKKLAVTEANDAYSILNEEMARVNTNAKFREAISAAGLGTEVPAGKVPDGYRALPGMERQIPIQTDERLTYKPGKGWGYTQPEERGATILRRQFIVPEGIAKGLTAITDPGLQNKFLARVNEIQSGIKTLDLVFSAFHHLAMLHTLIAQTKGGIDLLTHLPQMRKWAASGELDAAEQDFVRHTGMTTRVESNADVMRGLIQGDDVLSKATRLPGVKQILQGAEKSSDFLFDNIQRKMKVIDYANKAAAWLGDHPNATERQIVEAKRSIASEINAAYGGLNWTALGVSKSTLGLMRLVMLAPDWTASNILLPLKIAQGGPGATAAASHLISATIASTLATAGLNHILHGDDNQKTLALLKAGKYDEAGASFMGQRELGHELEVEVTPGVYIPMFRGGISDIVKLYSLVHELGPARGALQFGSNKLAPFPRAAVGAISNTVSGRPILVPYNPSNSWLQNTAAQLKQTGQLVRPALPVPLGISQAYQVLSRPDKSSVLGVAAALSGAGRVTSGEGPRTEAEKYMYRLNQLQGHSIYEEGTAPEIKYQLKSDLIRRAREGQNINKAVNEAVKAGQLSARDATDIFRRGRLDLFSERFKSLKDLNSAIDVYKLANPAERKLIDDQGLLWKKAKDILPSLAPDEQKKVLQRLDEIKKAAKPKPVGVSRAQQLGIPMSIPQRQPDEPDVAYRARLLQLGRARSSRLDTAANSPDFAALNRTDQRKSLYSALYS